MTEDRYSLIDTIDFPQRNIQYPAPDQLDTTSGALSAINVKPFLKDPDEWGIAGI